MTDYTAAEVKQYVEYLENDGDHRKMRDAAIERHKLTNMLKVPELPEHMTRGIGTSEPSPMLIWLANNVIADTLPYPTNFSVVPFGTTQPLQEQADKIEKFGSLWRNRVDAGRVVTADSRGHQLLSPYAVMVLRCGPPGDPFPWEVERPDPLTCYFPIERGPFRPRVLARRYKQLVRDAVRTYSGRKNYKNNSWDNVYETLTYNGGRWEFVGDERRVDAEGSRNSGGPFEDCEFMELREGEMVYILALETGGDRAGTIVWQGKSMTGGVSAVVVPGAYLSVGEMADRMQPVLWPAMQMVHLINRVRAKRATRSENVKPDVLVEQSPEMYTAQAAAGTIAQNQNAALEAGGPNMVNVMGKPTLWAVEADPDLDKQEQSYWNELNRYINAMTEVSDSEIVKDATANAFLTNLESRKRQRAPMLANLDWGWNEIIKMALHSIVEYDQEFDLYATEDMGTIKKGQGQKIGPNDIDFENFWYGVETKSTTEAEARMRVQDWAYRKGLGLSTQREGITAAGYQDETEQFEKMAIDLGIQGSTPWVQQMVTQANIERIRLRANIMIPGGAPAGGAALGITANGAPGNAEAAGGAPTGGPPGGTGMQPMRPAAVPGPAGGSGMAP